MLSMQNVTVKQFSTLLLLYNFVNYIKVFRLFTDCFRLFTTHSQLFFSILIQEITEEY